MARAGDLSQGRALSAKRAAMGVLFAAILLIPRLRRLRRNRALWTAIRIVAAAFAAWWLVEFGRGAAGAGSLAAGIVLGAFAAIFGARPEKKTLETLSRELNALVMLNGGCLQWAGAGEGGSRVNLFVLADRVVAVAADERHLAEIPLSAVRSASVHPSLEKPNRAPDWQLDVRWEASGPQTASFRYQGVFAEHLARVAERTLSSVWKKELPVLPQ